jgi:hypothetical protein
LIRFCATASGRIGAVTIRGKTLLALPVRLHGIQLARPIDLLLDREELKVLGLHLRCGDGVDRFLPLPAASVREDEIAIQSPLVMLEEDQLAFYRSRAFALSSLRGRSVERRRREVGLLDDVVFSGDGTLQELVVTTQGHEERLPFDETVRIVLESRSAA